MNLNKYLRKALAESNGHKIGVHLRNDDYLGNNEESKKVQSLIYETQTGEVIRQGTSEDPPVIKYCDELGDYHSFVFKFKIYNSGNYTLLLTVDDKGSTGGQFRSSQVVIVTENDAYVDSDNIKLEATAPKGVRQLKLNVLEVPSDANFTSLNKITAGAYGSFEKIFRRRLQQ